MGGTFDYWTIFWQLFVKKSSGLSFRNKLNFMIKESARNEEIEESVKEKKILNLELFFTVK